MPRDKSRFIFITEREANESEKHPRLIRWFRSIGLISILFGGLGLMKTFYATSVIAIYAGICLLALDVFYEDLHLLMKCLSVIALLVLATLFTKAVVLHKSPMQYEYRIDQSQLELEIENDSQEDDYDDVDLVVTPTSIGSGRFVGQVKFDNGDQSCAFVRTPGIVLNGHTSIFYSPDGKTLEDWPDAFRIRCAKLPKQFSVWINVRFVQATSGQSGMPVAAAPDGVPSVRGTFTGRYRTVDVDQRFAPF